MIGWTVGLGIWIGMTLWITFVLALQIIALLALFIGSWFRSAYYGWLDRDAIWRILLCQLPTPFASLLMPALVWDWNWLPARLAYALNTPDDPDPVNQGWNGTNKESQVIWVRAHCGPFWCRVYWLQRNCLYGLAVLLRGRRVDFKTASYAVTGNLVTVIWGDKPLGLLVVPAGLLLRVWPVRFFGRWLIIYFGWKLWAYLDSIVPLKLNASPEQDPMKDTGGVPVLTLRIRSSSPLAAP